MNKNIPDFDKVREVESITDTSYLEDISINPDALDVEWTRQAQTFFKYAELTAKARDKMDRIKETLDVKDAQLGLKIRSNPAAHGLEKVTEASVQALLLIDKDRMLTSENLASAKYELEILIAAVRALDQKKAALENLVRLQGQNYFAGPEAPRNIGKEWVKEVERDRARDKVKAAQTLNKTPTGKRSIAR